MIKLDKSYSDYTDETDEKFPAGKAVNASSSESYDGTPWLAEMMNDEHGARQAIYKAAYGSVDGLSGVPDNVDQSDTLNAIKKLIDDPDKEHADLRGSEAHGATVAASPGQIVTRDEFGRAKVAAPLEDDDIARKKEIDELVKMVKDAVIRKGFTYTQWPGELSPVELGLPGEWADISYKYAGLFMRVAGGEAVEFNKQLSVLNQAGTELTFAEGHGLTTQNLIINLETGERRAVTKINGNVVTVDKSFTSNLTTVLIGQNEGLPNIKGSLDMRGMEGGEATVLGTYSGALFRNNYSGESHTQLKDGGTGSYRSRFGFDASRSNNIYARNSHVTPFNLSLKVWKRIS